MTSKKNKERLIASTLLAGVASLGVPIAVGGAVVFATATDASAQDYTSGTLRGRVADESGAPLSGVQVTIRSKSQGFRATSTNANGEFTVPVIPIGAYTVSISADGLLAH